MSRMNNARKGIGFGIINNFLNIVLPFVSRTIILYTLGTEYLGLGGLFTSIINVLNISELGFSAAVSYILYKPVADRDDSKVCAILGFARKCFSLIGLIISVGGIAVMPFLKNLISGDVPDGINIYILYIVYLANVVVSYLMFAYKRILFSANQRYDIETNIASITILLQYVLQIVMLIAFKNYYIYALIVPVMTIFSNLACQYYTKKLYPQYFCKGKISKEEVSVLKKKVGGSFFSKLGETVYLSVNNIVISAIFGLHILGQYGNYYYVTTSLMGIFAVVHNTMRPIIGNCVATEDKDINFKRFLQFDNVYMWVSSFCTCCLVCLYQDFIKIWVGEENMFPFYMAVLFAVYFFVGRISCVTSIFIESTGLWWESRFVAIIAAAVNLVFSLVLADFIGLAGVLVSSAISSVVVSFVGRIYVLFKYYFTKKECLEYLKESFKIVVLSAISIIAVYFATTFISAGGYIGLILKAVAVVVLFAIIYFVMHSKSRKAREIWRLVIDFTGLKKIFNRIKGIKN